MSDPGITFTHAMRAKPVDYHEAATGFDLDGGTDAVVMHVRSGGADSYFTMTPGQALALAVGLHRAATGQPPLTE